ncbi:MAG: mandelate racemase/muconate lactonizing enzyme family protein [Nitrososphaeria archaeon]|jgi:galactonate dehydratase
MKISDIKTYIVGTGCAVNWVFVKLFTDEGIVGISEVSTVYGEEAQAQVVAKLKPYILGKDPLEMRKIFNSVYKNQLDIRGPGSLEITALAGIEVACWDILGKKSKTPLYTLLGGKYNDKVRAYAHCEPVFPKIAHDTKWIIKNAVKLVDEGFRYLKFDPFWFYPEGEVINAAELENAEEKLKTVRDSVGKEIEIGIEIHAKYNLPSAMRICKKLEKYDPWFFEEPVGSEDFGALKTIASKTSIPIASGERLCTKHAFRDMISGHCVDIVQIDPLRAGGFIESIAIANMAETYTLPVVIHDPYGPVYDAICAHLSAAIPNLLALEFPMYYYVTDPSDLRSRIVKEPILCKDSFLEPSSRPGLGIEFNEDILDKFSKVIE